MDIQNNKETQIDPLNPSEQKTRYLIPRQIERSLITTLGDIYEDLLEKGVVNRRLSDELLFNLEQNYNSWQSLSSGSSGEAIVYMTGSGILEGIPDVYGGLQAESSQSGVNISLTPKNKSDRGIIEVVTYVGGAYAKFSFHTSLKEIEHRKSVLNNEINKATRQKDEDFNIV